MNAHELKTLYVVHIASVVTLLAYTFYGFAAALESKRRVMMITGISALLILLSGIRMWQGVYGFAPLVWVFVKLGCWLGLAALAGIGYRKRDQGGLWRAILLGLAVLALAMVYFVRL